MPVSASPRPLATSKLFSPNTPNSFEGQEKVSSRPKQSNQRDDTNSGLLKEQNRISTDASNILTSNAIVTQNIQIAPAETNGSTGANYDTKSGPEDMSMSEDQSGVYNSPDSTQSLQADDEGEESVDADHHDLPFSDLPPLHVEVRLKPNSTVRYDLIRRMMHTHLDSEYETLLTHSEVHDWKEVASLAQNVERVWVAECSIPTSAVPLSRVSLHIHVYQPPSTSSLSEFSTSGSSQTHNNMEDGDNDEENEEEDSNVMAASVLKLPSISLEGVWDSLIYDGQVKEKLLGYIYSTLVFSDVEVDFNIVTWNRVVLLHGPPGTGKTSLCRALAQKLAIRLSDRYEHGKLIEINSHSLFSKWFSESGKLVQKLFKRINEMVDDEEGFVVVLIDEVESLTAARAGAMSGKEPSDALRVVNALLTQLDKLKHRKNCLVMTTSNLSAAIDDAFIDRADIKQYVGLPPAQAVYWILQTCLNEIMRAGLIKPTKLGDWTTVEMKKAMGVAVTLDGDGSSSKTENEMNEDLAASYKLFELSHLCKGMSGRTLRRLPVLAHARHLGLSSASSLSGSRRKPTLPMSVWLDAMHKCVEEEKLQLGLIQEGGVTGVVSH